MVLTPGTVHSPGFAASPLSLVEIHDRLCVYYGAFDADHTYTGHDMKAATGRAWLRKDGFASMTGGRLLTKPLRLEAGSLFVNASGKLSVRSLDVTGRILASSAWEGDSIEAPVVWQTGETPAPGQPVRLEFNLAQGHLYSFWSE